MKTGLIIMGFTLLSACQPNSRQGGTEALTLSYDFDKNSPVASIGYEGPIFVKEGCAIIELAGAEYALALPRAETTRADNGASISVSGISIVDGRVYSASVVVTDDISASCGNRKISRLIPPLSPA